MVVGYRQAVVMLPPSDVDDKLDWLFAESDPTVHSTGGGANAGRTSMSDAAINARMVSSFIGQTCYATRPRECGAVREI